MPPERLRWREIRATTPFRLTLGLASLFLVGLWVALGLSYVLTAAELTARSDQILFGRAHSLLAEPPAHLPTRIRADIVNLVPGVNYTSLEGRSGEYILGNIHVPDGPPLIGHTYTIGQQPGTNGPLRVLKVRTPFGETITLARDFSPVRDLRGRLLQILFASGIVGTAGALGAAIWLSRAPLRRVRDLARASQLIAAGDFAHRMPIAGRHDELDQFAVTVNIMLDEVAHVIAQVKSATDAIAHDLRTPLTRVRASLHRALQSEDLAAGPAAITAQALVDLDAVMERFAAILRISELEASGRRAGLCLLDLGSLVDEARDLYEPLAEESGIALSLAIEAPPTIKADRALMLEAIGNLLDNAIKYARTRVTIRACAVDGDAIVEVADDGPGIPAGERDAVLRRFHRAKGASGVEGTGLGLAVVSAILHLHGFALTLDDAAPGLVLRVRMPAESPPEPK